MEILRLSALSAERRRQILERAGEAVFAPAVRRAAREALEAVRSGGDQVLLDYTARFDGAAMDRSRLRVSDAEIDAAYGLLPAGLLDALQAAIARARRYNERLRPADWLQEMEPGVTVGVKYTPLASLGVYIPSGKGRFPSTAVTILTPAVVAGVPEIRVVLPPRADGSADPAVLAACDLLGVREIFRCNGVAGVAALALGSETIPAVTALAGPGNPYVAAVQLEAQAYGLRTLALLGPTEAVVLADDAADPRRVALDLINEAEHGTDSAALLLTDSDRLAREVALLVDEYLRRLPDDRRVFAESALSRYGGILVADSFDQAVAFVNAYAPEHLLLATRRPEETLARIVHAGEILLGQHTPFAAGNYAIGVPAALPTGRSARVSSGITVLSFLKTSSVAALDERGLAAVRPVVEALGAYEGFPAHVMAVTDR
ncbi:MAG: histidinol dehydrogenase [Armatimonadota bacterium]|nr:histidinol dehydrogenase [Armatimonadota bacterium]MDR7450657.1 histidinol dehydrogenase [Armatimonadota bacterium]MDR7466210.1 histidinol dehydrogenase [Armatimonadota bacterium]MDR7492931.1 histidinol dehydrogenase [Armatimonadota bacterium]MDR7498312.1 histidinol dehydrogenase [Armatimonadota bacterium]